MSREFKRKISELFPLFLAGVLILCGAWLPSQAAGSSQAQTPRLLVSGQEVGNEIVMDAGEELCLEIVVKGGYSSINWKSADPSILTLEGASAGSVIPMDMRVRAVGAGSTELRVEVDGTSIRKTVKVTGIGTVPEPVTPEDPPAPVTPEEPEQPVTPEEPEEPEQPVTPEEPEQPEQPVTPEEPEQPVIPEEPVVKTSFTINYLMNAGTLLIGDKSYTGSYAVLYEKESVKQEEMPLPVREGYTFEGWCYIGVTASGEYYIADRINVFSARNGSKTNVIAKWTEKPKDVVYKITYNVNGGKQLTQAQLAGKTSYTYGKVGTGGMSLPTPTRSGYSFAGWYKLQYDNRGNIVYKEKVSSITNTTKGDLSLIAKWNKKSIWSWGWW